MLLGNACSSGATRTFVQPLAADPLARPRKVRATTRATPGAQAIDRASGLLRLRLFAAVLPHTFVAANVLKQTQRALGNHNHLLSANTCFGRLVVCAVGCPPGQVPSNGKQHSTAFYDPRVLALLLHLDRVAVIFLQVRPEWCIASSWC